MRLFVSLAAAAIVIGCSGGQPDASITATHPVPSVAPTTTAPSNLPPGASVSPDTSAGTSPGPLPVDRLPSEGSILFTAEVSGASMVARVAPNGLDATQLVRGTHPDWSPSGQSLAFSCVTEPNAEPPTLGTCVSRADGSGRAILVQDGYAPQFSPNGAHIAYLQGVIDVPDVFVTDARAPGDGQLVGRSAFVRWSPDSERLLLHTDAGSLTIVSRDGDVLQTIGGYDGAWSPDGSRIAFFRIVGTVASLQLADAANGSVSATGYTTESAPEGIVWLADDRLLFLMDGDIWRLDLAAPTQPSRLTVDLGIDWPTLSASPDRGWVAFTKTEGQGAGLYVASVNGGWALIVAAIQLRNPSWQPAP